MERKPRRRLPGIATEAHFWQSPLGVPAQGAVKEEIAPLVEEAFLEALGDAAWSMFGEHWKKRKAAFAEMDRSAPDGLAALARFCTGHFLKRLPKDGITQTALWDEFLLYMVRLNHDYQDDGAFADYLKDRIGIPGWQNFLRRALAELDAKENPELRQRFIFCTFWDVFPLPLRYWADAASAELLASTGPATNLDKVRNTRRQLGLRRRLPIIVKRYVRLPATQAAGVGRLHIEINEAAAKHHRLSATVEAFLKFLKEPNREKS
jgi:hypothetical protein